MEMLQGVSMNLQKSKSALFPLVGLSMILALFMAACGGTTSTTSTSSSLSPSTTTSKIKVVAAENFWGNIAQQIGGSYVSVTSILSNPNTDPHTFESNNATAQAVSQSQLLIYNGRDYDTWMNDLLSASPNSKRDVIVANNVAKDLMTDNPHLWYDPNNASDVASAIATQLSKIDPAHATTFHDNLTTFNNSLKPVENLITNINTQYAGTPIALTETIYLYQTKPEGLDVLTPFSFEDAIAEGNDPPANTITEANDQITSKQAKVLIYNEQTITTITTNMQNEAKKEGIPVVPVYETMPPQYNTYQQWMSAQLTNLTDALAQATGK
jgi:zinc/manganese transport system substrate-binding protein